MTLFTDAIMHAWDMLIEAAPYIWLGLVAAGALHAWVPQEWILSQLGGRNTSSVLKAALVGIPIPLCSCGVIPAAVGLRKRGAGRGATLSFLISTPETSVDSIALTWAMLGPIWAVIRPVASVIVAVVTGIVANVLPDQHQVEAENHTCSDCHNGKETVEMPAKLSRARHFVFRELLPDIGGWLLLGIALSGLVLAILPDDFLTRLPGGPGIQMLLALLVGIPLYICAAASTPLAAALLMKGMAPGAALVLLLAGPATNLASALVVSRQLGKVGTAVYFMGVAFGSLAVGVAVQWLAPVWHLGQMQDHGPILPLWLHQLLGVMLVVSIVWPRVAKWHRSNKDRSGLHKLDSRRDSKPINQP